jgi:hypothetical protein
VQPSFIVPRGNRRRSLNCTGKKGTMPYEQNPQQTAQIVKT